MSRGRGFVAEMDLGRKLVFVLVFWDGGCGNGTRVSLREGWSKVYTGNPDLFVGFGVLLVHPVEGNPELI